MTTFVLSNLTGPIRARIVAAIAPAGSAPSLAGAAVLVEDQHDLVNEISIALDKIGMLILIGSPNFDQHASEFSPVSVLKITLAIAIGEVPILWRVDQNKPKAQDAAVLLTQLLHNLKLPGFQNLKVTAARLVPDKQRKLYELTIETAMTANQLP